MGDLWEKLRASRDKLGSEPEPPETTPAEADEAPEGWRWTAPLVAERRVVFPLDARFWKALEGEVAVEQWRGVLCFDTETTGLSGGAGTLPFLIGWAQLVSGDGPTPAVEVRQWFLRDMPGEPDLIEAVDAAMASAEGLVSFNGASFDLPLLKSRWALAGRPFPEKPHRDDLHPARRLWKRLLESCRLSRLEQTVLGLNRVDDVPGSLVPALWFEYLRQGAAADFLTPLEGVLRHHAQDVYSLLCLDLILAGLARNPGNHRWEETFGAFPERPSLARLAPAGLLHPDLGRQTPVDFWGLLLLRNDDDAWAALEAAWQRHPSEAVGLAWAERLKRCRDPRARDVWTRLWEASQSYPALVELLKWLEHRDRGEAARREALARIDAALKAPFLPRVWSEALEKRRVRLSRPPQGPP
jgi:uncharacterized protein YprB with RNaseH-like and TPR domain